jgi:hypothetical protein
MTGAGGEDGPGVPASKPEGSGGDSARKTMPVTQHIRYPVRDGR